MCRLSKALISGGCHAPGSASLHLGLLKVPALRACFSTSAGVAHWDTVIMRDRLRRRLQESPASANPSPESNVSFPTVPGVPLVQSMGSCLMSRESSPRCCRRGNEKHSGQAQCLGLARGSILIGRGIDLILDTAELNVFFRLHVLINLPEMPVEILAVNDIVFGRPVRMPHSIG
jgi:hypothetical protein